MHTTYAPAHLAVGHWLQYHNNLLYIILYYCDVLRRFDILQHHYCVGGVHECTYNGLSLSCLVLTVSNSWADAANSLLIYIFIYIYIYMTIVYNDIKLSYTAAAATAVVVILCTMYMIVGTYRVHVSFCTYNARVCLTARYHTITLLSDGFANILFWKSIRKCRLPRLQWW